MYAVQRARLSTAVSTTTDADTAAFMAFPSAATEQGSPQFVKKLLAVIVSNITYLRNLFPRGAFRDKSVGGLSVKVLRLEGNPCGEAADLAAQLQGVFDAIERKFLRELLLVVHADPKDHVTAEEVYAFRWVGVRNNFHIFFFFTVLSKVFFILSQVHLHGG